MKKTRIAIYISLLLCFAVFSIEQSISKSVVSATTGQAVFCPNNFQPGLDTQNEISLSTATCTWIASLLASRSTYGCYLEIDTTVSEYISVLDTLNTWFNPEIVFSKGHNPPWSQGADHYYLVDHNGAQVRDSIEIWPHTSEKFQFVFLWHCATAESYPSNYDEDGWQGHAMCWTHDNTMVPFSYPWYGEKVFIGWDAGYDMEHKSPQFEAQAIGVWNYAHVAYLFWYAMVDLDCSVYEALNYVTNQVWNIDFFGSSLCSGTDDYGGLVVYGNFYFGHLP